VICWSLCPVHVGLGNSTKILAFREFKIQVNFAPSCQELPFVIWSLSERSRDRVEVNEAWPLRDTVVKL
jgi:hypothetical protein